MNSLAYLTTTLALSSVAAAQLPGAQAPGAYDAFGDPVSPNSTAFQTRAPGDLWATISPSYGTTDGVAPYQGGLLVSSGDGFAYHIDEATGAELNAFPVENNNDRFLGYDSSRDLIITVNAAESTIRGYTPGSAVPVFDVTTASQRPVGVAWDSTRDEYVYCDWDTDVIVVMDAATLSVTRTFTMPLTRMIGVAYDCVDDVYVIGDRDARNHSLVHPMSGAISLSYPTAAIGTSIPRGAALSSNGGIWTGDFNVTTITLQEAGHGPIIHSCSPGGLGTNYCMAELNSTGTISKMSAQGSAVVAQNQVSLVATSLPNFSFGFFIASLDQGFVPNPAGSNGNLCLGGAIGRYVGPGQIMNSGNNGAFSLAIDLTAMPQPLGFVSAMPGETWNFQAWHRDSINGVPGSNFTNGLSIDLQ